MVLYVTVAPEHLNGVVTTQDRGGEGLAVRFGGVGEGRLAPVQLPRRAPHREPGRIDRDRHVGDLEGDGLERADRFPEGLTLGGVLARVLQTGASTADGDRSRQQLRPDRSALEVRSGLECLS